MLLADAAATATNWDPYIAAGAGLFGVFVGGLITLLTDKRSWVRGERMRVYSDLLAHAQRVESALTDITLGATHIIGAQAPHAVADAIESLDLSLERVKLVGTEETTEATGRLRDALHPLNLAARPFIESDEVVPDDDPRRETFKEAVRVYLSTRGDLITQMRDDLT